MSLRKWLSTLARNGRMRNLRRHSADSPALRRRAGVQSRQIESLEHRTLLAAVTSDYVPGEVMVGLSSSTPIEDADAHFQSMSWDGTALHSTTLDFDTTFSIARSGGDYLAVYQVQLPDGASVPSTAAELSLLSGVEFAAPNYTYGSEVELVPNDPLYSQQYHHALVGNPSAWDTTLGNASIIVGVTDTGVDWDHEDLAANIWTNPGDDTADGIDNDNNGFVDDIRGWDFRDNDNNPDEESGTDHGTHVAGIAAAVTNNAVGVAGTAGRSRIMPLRIGSAPTSAIYAGAFTYAVDNGASIVNTSFNINGRVGDPTFTAALQNLYDNGLLHFNSAGNGNELNPVRQAFHQTLLTANTTSTDTRSGSSNYGTGIDIAAPGSSIRSTEPGDTYGLKGGTSMAAPNAAGAAALIWSANPAWTRDQVAAQLLGTADNIDALNPGFAGLLGAGRINTGRALSEALAPPQLSVVELSAPAGTRSLLPPTSSLTVDFEFILAEATVEDSDNWELRSWGADNTFDTADDVVIPMTTPSDYMIGMNEFELTFPMLSEGVYRFTAVSDGLENPFGMALDGNGDGTAGDHFVREFVIGTKIEIANFDFSDDATGDPAAEGFTSSGSANQWHLSTGRGNDSGHSADDSFYFGANEGANGGGSYQNNADGTLRSPAFDLSGYPDVLLEFSHFLQREDGFDEGRLSVTDGSTTIVLDDNVAETSGFATVSYPIDLTGLDASQIQFLFSFDSDGSITDEGWYLDDVVVSVITAPVILTESGGSTDVAEDGGVDTYTVQLPKAPTGDVEITVTADDDTEISADGSTFSSSLVLSIDDAAPRTITVRAVDDAFIEKHHVSVIAHAITGVVNDAAYPAFLPIDPVFTGVEDNEALPDLIAIDFGGGTSPTNWTAFSSTSDAAISNLPDESGNSTSVDVNIDFDNTLQGGNENFVPPAGQLPVHGQSLAGVDRAFTDAGNIQLTFSDLEPGLTYEVYVFAGDVFASNQLVTITGDSVVSFAQPHAANQLFVNDEAGDSGRALETYARTVMPNASNEILVRVDNSNAGNPATDFFGLAGIALRPLPLIAPTFINEIVVDPPNTDSPNEYVELRGTAGTPLDDFYLIFAEGDAGTSLGELNSSELIDLSGTSIGTNGFLIITDDANDPYPVAAGTTVVNVPGFDVENASYTAFLIHVDDAVGTAPVAGQDLDAGNNGLDALPAGWTLLDSVSVMDGDASDRAYAPIVFSSDGDGLTEPGAVLIDAGFGAGDSIGHVMRIGDSEGSTAADWVAFELTGNAPEFLVAASTDPAYRTGAIITDHLGETNPVDAFVPLLLSIDMASMAENGGVATATVTRSGVTGQLRVDIVSDDTTEATVPASVLILDQNNSATFPVTAVDDMIVDGTQSVRITVTATGHGARSELIDVTDDDTPGLTLTIAANEISEGDGAAATTATVTRNTDTTNPLVVTLTSSDTTAATVSPTVTISAGQASVTFDIDAVDDPVIDGTQTVTITADQAAHAADTDTLDVTDDDIAGFGLIETDGDTTTSESFASDTFDVVLLAQPASDVVIDVASPDTGEVVVDKSTLTFTSANWNRPQTVTVTGRNDFVVDGDIVVPVRLSVNDSASDDPFDSFPDQFLNVTNLDNDSPRLTVGPVPPATGVRREILESDGPNALMLAVSRNTVDVSTAVTVTLSNGDASEISVPMQVTIPVGAAFAAFAVDAVDDALADGTQRAPVGATAPGFIAAQNYNVYVEDDDAPQLTITFADPAIDEPDGAAATTATVRRNTPVDDPMTVLLGSSDTSEATVPASVTIPAGSDFATFPVNAVDDFVVDGTQSVSISAVEDAPAFDARIDLSFGSGGRVFPDIFDNVIPGSVDMALQPDGKFLVLGHDTVDSNRIHLSRFHPDGSPDAGFGIGGAVRQVVPGPSFAGTFSLELLPDGRIVAYGHAAGGDMTVVRYLTDGTVDTSLDSDGILQFPTMLEGRPMDFATAPDGSMFFVSSTNFDAVRFRSFSADGTMLVSNVVDLVPGTDEFPESIARQADGKLVVVGGLRPGSGNNEAFIARFNPDGTIDGTYGVGGVQTLDGGSTSVRAAFSHLAIQSDGKAVAAGFVSDAGASSSVHQQWVVARFNTNGSFDTTFSTDGLDRIDFRTGDSDLATSVLVEPSGRILVGGSAEISPTTGELESRPIVRYNADGSLDTGFGTGGIQILSPLAGFGEEVDAGVIQPNGQLLLLSGDTFVPRVERYDLDPGPITGQSTIDVLDDEVPELTLNIAAAFVAETDGPGATTATVSRNTDTTNSLEVTLTSGDTSEVTVPATVTIPAGQATSLPFDINAVDDLIVDGTQTVTITAVAAGHSDGTDALDVTDDDVPQLTVDVVADSVSEADGPAATTVIVTRNFDLANPLTVQLASSDTSEAFVVGSVNIPAGDLTSPPVAVDAVDDFLVDGTQTVTITASILQEQNSATVDSGFGVGGLVQTTLRHNISPLRFDALQQPDGKLLFIGRHPNDDETWQLLRLNPDGSPDVTFGVGGIASTTVPGLLVFRPFALELLSDGRIVALGRGGSETIITRYQPDGSPDTTFDSDGVAALPDSVMGTVLDVAVNPDGSMWVAGTSGGDPAMGFPLALIGSDGSLGAITRLNVGSDPADFESVAQIMRQSDGRIVVAGTVDSEVFVARFSDDGTPDASFSGDGVAPLIGGTIPATLYATDLALDGQGRILVSGGPRVAGIGSFAPGGFVARVNPDGSTDTSFSSDGFAPVAFAAQEAMYDVEVLPDGKIILVGSLSVSGSGFERAIVRFRDDGLLDPGFDGDGIQFLPSLPSVFEEIFSAVVQSDGKLVTFSERFENFRVERFDLFSGPALTASDSLDVTDDDVPALRVTIADNSILESDGAGATTATVTRNTDPASDLIVSLMSDDVGEATVIGTVTIPAGRFTSDPFNIDAVDDTIVDLVQTVTITAQAAGHADGTDTVDVLNDDTGTFSVSDVTMSENDAGSRLFTFTVTLDTDVDVGVDVDYETVDRTATAADGDFDFASGTVSFAGSAGETQTVAVSVNGDVKLESNEFFNLDLVALRAMGRDVVVGNSGDGTILNDDTAALSIGAVSTTEGTGGTRDLVFTVTLDNDVQDGFTVAYTTDDGTATIADSDYVDNDASLAFSGTAGETQSIAVTVNSDAKVELDEVFAVALQSVSGADPVIASAVVLPAAAGGTIFNDDSAQLVVDNPSIVEGDSGTQTLVFTVTLDLAVDAPVTAEYDTMDGTALLADNDYTDSDGTVSFTGAAGETQTLAVPLTGDTTVELNESFHVLLSNLSAAGRAVTLDNSGGTGAIVNDDTATLTVSSPTVTEGDTAAKQLIFTVTSDSAVDVPYSVDAATADDTAASSDFDYTPTSATLNFSGAVGETRTFSVPILGDLKVELDEQFLSTLTNVQAQGRNVTPSGLPGLGSILNDDSASVIISDLGIQEGDTGVSTASLIATLNGAVDTDVTVFFTTSDDSALISDADYNAATGSIVFPSGSAAGATQAVDVQINGDTVVEQDERFNVHLTSLSAGLRDVTIGDDLAIGTIQNDDSALITIDDVALAEADFGHTSFVFTVRFEGQSDAPASLSFATVDDLATAADPDYLPTSGSLSFSGADGETRTIRVSALGDNILERDETFLVGLSALDALGRNVTFDRPAGVGTILNDDAASLEIDDVTLEEGNSGTRSALFTVRLAGDVDASFTIDYQTNDGTATVAGDDYTDSSGSLTFAGLDGELQTLAVPVHPDLIVETAETFTVNLTSIAAGGRSIAVTDGQGLGTITNDDSATIRIDDVSASEGNSGTADLVFTVTLDAAVDVPVNVDFATSDNTATVADNDYNAVVGGLTFQPDSAGGLQTMTLAVQVNGDVTTERDETFFLDLSGLSAAGRNVSIGRGNAVGTVVNDDSARISIDDAGLVEGDSGFQNLVFTVTLDSEVDTGVGVGYSTGNGTASVADNDFSFTSGSLNFPAAGGPGPQTMTLAVPVTGDTKVEASEAFVVNLHTLQTAGRAVSLIDGQGTGSITDNDSATVSIGDAALAEGTGGLTEFHFEIVLNGRVDTAVDVVYATADGTAAEADADYIPRSGVLDFAGNASGPQTLTVVVQVAADEKVELDEDFTLNLLSLDSAGRDVTLAKSTGNGSISDDDTATLSVEHVSGPEGDLGDSDLLITIVLDAPVDTTVSADFNLADGSAVAGVDYRSGVSGTRIDLAPGTRTLTVSVPVIGDRRVESNESFTAFLSNLSAGGRNVALDVSPAVATILNDDHGVLDVDDNLAADAATDGILVLRYLFGFRGTALTDNAIGSSATNTTPGEVESVLDSSQAMLDVDGNGVRDAATDGILIIRYLFGFRGDALVSGAIGSGATRTTGDEVAAFLEDFTPLPPAPVPPAPPTGSAVTVSVNDRTPAVTWVPQNGANSYRITIENLETEQQIVSASTTSTVFTTENRLTVGEYRVWVEALGSNGAIIRTLTQTFRLTHVPATDSTPAELTSLQIRLPDLKVNPQHSEAVVDVVRSGTTSFELPVQQDRASDRRAATSSTAWSDSNQRGDDAAAASTIPVAASDTAGAAIDELMAGFIMSGEWIE